MGQASHGTAIGNMTVQQILKRGNITDLRPFAMILRGRLPFGAAQPPSRMKCRGEAEA